MSDQISVHRLQRIFDYIQNTEGISDDEALKYFIEASGSDLDPGLREKLQGLMGRYRPELVANMAHSDELESPESSQQGAS